MDAVSFLEYVPRLIQLQHWKRRSKFFQYESVHNEWIVFGVEDGSFYYEIGEQHAVASFGDLVFCPPGYVFRRVVISPITLFVIRLNWRDDQGRELPPPRHGGLPVGKIGIRDTQRLLTCYAAMKQDDLLHDRWSRVRTNHYLHHIWVSYCEESGVANEGTGEASSLEPVIQQAVQLIRKQAFQQCSIHLIADSLGMSRASLSKRFRSELGTTPIKYLTDLRLAKAKALLVETNLTLDQISECCGYQNGFYLNRVFKKHCQMPPIQFRKEHRL